MNFSHFYGKEFALQQQTAIVILNYNGKNWLEMFLPTLIRHSTLPDVAIWVADNASTDDSLAYIKSNFPSINTVQLKENLGFAGGYNLALKHIKADIYVLLNSDVEVTENWLTPLTSCLKQDTFTAACQPKILAFHAKDHFEYAGGSGGYIDSLGFPFCRGRLMEKLEKDEGQYDDSREIFWASGACLAIKADLFHLTGGFDAHFFAHMEEIDLCWRLKNAGYSIKVVPKSSVYHVGGGTLPAKNPYKVFLNFRNNRLMLIKNLPQYDLLSVNFTRNFLDLAAFFKSLLTLQFSEAKAIFKAHRAFQVEMNLYLQKRAEQLAFIKNNAVGKANKAGLFKGSLVLEYYIKRKSKFSQLKISK